MSENSGQLAVACPVYRAFVHWCHEHGLPHTGLRAPVWLHDFLSLRGRHDLVVHVVTWPGCPDFPPDFWPVLEQLVRDGRFRMAGADE